MLTVLYYTVLFPQFYNCANDNCRDGVAHFICQMSIFVVTEEVYDDTMVGDSNATAAKDKPQMTSSQRPPSRPRRRA